MQYNLQLTINNIEPIAHRPSTLGNPADFYRNRGDGKFDDKTSQSGLYNPIGKALGVALLDYNNDGWIDLAVANDTEPNFLYRNNGDGTFTDEAVVMGVALQ